LRSVEERDEKRRNDVILAYDLIREILPCATVKIIDDPGIPGVARPFSLIEVVP